MSIFTIFIVLILAPLLKRIARLASFAIVFPFALLVLLAKTSLRTTSRMAQRVH